MDQTNKRAIPRREWGGGKYMYKESKLTSKMLNWFGSESTIPQSHRLLLFLIMRMFIRECFCWQQLGLKGNKIRLSPAPILSCLDFTERSAVWRKEKAQQNAIWDDWMALLPWEEVCIRNFVKTDCCKAEHDSCPANTSSNQQEANKVNRLSKAMGLDPH